MLGIVLAAIFIILIIVMAVEAYILSPKRIEDANRILAESYAAQTDFERTEMRKTYDEIMCTENRTTVCLMVLFLFILLLNLIYIIIYKPFD